MPYITEVAKQRLGDGGEVDTPGELNYVLTCICLQYMEDNGTYYISINDVVGALECAKQEFYRRVVVPYEKKKRKENGDVYPDV